MTTTSINFEVLRQKYGSHSEAARQLELSVRHYAAIRAGKSARPLTMRVIREEIEKARKELENG